jgi:site-specific DNA recombinase
MGRRLPEHCARFVAKLGRSADERAAMERLVFEPSLEIIEGGEYPVAWRAARLKRTGIEMRLLVDDRSEPANVDPSLARLLLRAYVIRARLLEEPSLPLKEIAAEQGISSSYVTRLLRLAFFAPDIVAAILTGRHPPQLTANRLMDDTRLPLDWTAQREILCT